MSNEQIEIRQTPDEIFDELKKALPKKFSSKKYFKRTYLPKKARELPQLDRRISSLGRKKGRQTTYVANAGKILIEHILNEQANPHRFGSSVFSMPNNTGMTYTFAHLSEIHWRHSLAALANTAKSNEIFNTDDIESFRQFSTKLHRLSLWEISAIVTEELRKREESGFMKELREIDDTKERIDFMEELKALPNPKKPNVK